MKQIKLTITIIFLSSSLILGQNTDSIKKIECFIDSIALGQMESFEIPGLAIGFIMNNRIIYSKGFGIQSLDSKIPVTNSTLFHMASVSKTFVATAIVQLVEQNKISLDSTLVYYLPYFRMDDERYKSITIKHVLSHSSGIPDVDDYEWDKPQYDDLAAERYVKGFTDKKLKFNPGERFSYCNAGYDIMADVISKVSGLTFEEYMKKNIFEPIGMVNSTFQKTKVPEYLATCPHVLDSNLNMSVSKIYPYNRIHAPSSTLHSNLHDMLMWARMLLNGGIINNKQIINPKSYELLTTPQIPKGNQDSMCLGWHLSYLGNKKMYSHTGGDIGYSTFFAFLPEDSIAVVVMGNNRQYWGGNPAYITLNKILLKKDVDYWIKPIHLELRKIILTDGIEKFKEEYYKEKENNPHNFQFERWCLDELGYWLIERRYFSQAIDIFKFNVELFPENARCHDSLGDAYRANGNKKEAIKWYESALSLDPDKENTKRKLTEILDE